MCSSDLRRRVKSECLAASRRRVKSECLAASRQRGRWAVRRQRGGSRPQPADAAPRRASGEELCSVPQARHGPDEAPKHVACRQDPRFAPDRAVRALGLRSQSIRCISDFMCSTVNLATTSWISMIFISAYPKGWQIPSPRSCVVGYDQGKCKLTKREAADARSLVVVFLIHHGVSGQKCSEGL